MGVFDGHLTTDSINLKPINDEISKLKIKTSVIEEVLTKIPFNAQGEITKDLDLKDFKILNVKEDTQNKSAVNYLQMKNFTTNMQYEVNMNNNKITNLQNPVSNQDAVTKQYVDNHPSNILNYIKKDPATGAYRGTVLLDSDNKLACNLSTNFTTDTYGVIHIDPKSLVKLNAELNQNGSVIVDENNKLKVNLNDNFLIDSNGKINLKITNGLTYDKTVMDNYRPISILPVLSKVFERIVHNQLYTYLEENNLLSHCQFGFRRKSSTEHAVTYFSDFIKNSMDKGKLTGAVFVDLRKAFDTIDHATLIAKLQIYGVRGKELTWFQSYLFNRQQFVSFQSTRSERQSIRCGVPQGSILGPLLFTIVINDITEQVKKCRILLYADDTVIFTSDKDSKKIEEMLNTEFNNVTRWFTNNNLVLNLKKAKTEFVLFGTHQQLANSEKVSISLNGKMINESELYEYLGVTMDKNLTMKVHLEKSYKRVMSRTKLLARIRNNISPWVAETIYKVMILPQMLYCSNIMLGLSNTHISQFERIRSRALAIINGRSQRVKLPTVNHAINKRCLVEVFKCQNGLAPPLFKNYFKKILHQKETRGNNTNLLLPKVRTEAGRKSFLFQGSKLYNKLPTALKQE